MATQLKNIDSTGKAMAPPQGQNSIGQPAFFFGQPVSKSVVDTTNNVAKVYNQPATKQFLQQTTIPVNITNRNNNYSGWLTSGLLLLTFVLTLIWYFFPERILRLLAREGSKHKAKYDDNQFARPGFILYVILGFTFIFTTSLFIYLATLKYFPSIISEYSFEQLTLFIPVLLIFYYLLRYIVMYTTGFLFNTQQQAAKQINAAFRVNLIQSLLLLPMLLVLLNFQVTVFYYLGFVILLTAMVYKWGFLLFIGVKKSKISLYHNILYLCALEIVPVIILLKLLENYGLVLYN